MTEVKQLVEEERINAVKEIIKLQLEELEYEELAYVYFFIKGMNSIKE